MDQKIIFVTILTWFIFMVFAIINAIVRNILYKPIIGEIRAHQLSTIVFMIIILLITYLVFYLTKIKPSTNDAFIIGALWLIFTICFEFIAGYYLFSNSWEKLIADYNILKGRIWSFVLLTMFLSPYLTRKLL